MFVFILSVQIAFPQPAHVRAMTIQSEPQYLSQEACQAAMEETGKMFVAGLPAGTHIRIGGSCVKPESVEG